jgi:hypothetical protein
MSDEPGGPIPQASFAFSDLKGIERVVWAYSQYLQKSPASAKNTKRRQTLERIQERLAAQLTSDAKEVQMFLDGEELEELLQAMLDFASLVKRLFPKNEERDAVIEGVNLWRLRLVHIMREFEVS